mmetsp:Transcript_63685/g.118335  ORF Transcript_63685/g.118335 Transcript_63685/m.118335 type:complete len:203 (-) Transcript_63685:251-859(-)
MCEMKPTKEYSPGPSEYSSAEPPPAGTALLSKAAMSASSVSACENSQSAARSALFPHAFRAALTCLSEKPMEHNIATASGSASPPEGATPGLAVSGNGSFTSGSSMCSKYQFAANSASAPGIARAARLAAFADTPIIMSCSTTVSFGAAGAGAVPAELLPPESGSSVSPGCNPFARRNSRLRASGIVTLQSSFVGTHFSSKA